MSHFQVHAGTHKTGSTAIQLVLREVRGALATQGVIMPGMEAEAAKHALLVKWLDAAAGQREREAFVKAACAHATSGAAGDRFLVTNETIIGKPPSAIKCLLTEAGASRSEMYFYVRPHVGLYTSLYLQSLKNGRIVAHLDEIDLSANVAFDFGPGIECFASEFGQNHVHVREFSRGVLKDGSIIADFWDFLALPNSLLPAALAVETLANPTPSAETAALLLAFARVIHTNLDSDDARRQHSKAVFALFRLLGSEDTLPSTPFALPLPLQEQIADTFEPDRKAFADRWFDRPASADWLREPLKKPLPLMNLPYPVIETALRKLHRKLIRASDDRMQRIVLAFLDALPTTTEGGAKVIPTHELDSRFPAPPSAGAREPGPASRAQQGHR